MEESNVMNSAYDYDNSLMILLIALLVVTFVLVLFVCYFVYEIMQFRVQEKQKRSVSVASTRKSTEMTIQ